jgi:hypothetical protein
MENTHGNLVYKTERMPKDVLVALGAFLDVEGAFDTTTFGFICTAAEDRGVEHNVVRWTHTMLSSQ